MKHAFAIVFSVLIAFTATEVFAQKVKTPMSLEDREVRFVEKVILDLNFYNGGCLNPWRYSDELRALETSGARELMVKFIVNAYAWWKVNETTRCQNNQIGEILVITGGTFEEIGLIYASEHTPRVVARLRTEYEDYSLLLAQRLLYQVYDFLDESANPELVEASKIMREQVDNARSASQAEQAAETAAMWSAVTDYLLSLDYSNIGAQSLSSTPNGCAEDPFMTAAAATDPHMAAALALGGCSPF